MGNRDAHRIKSGGRLSADRAAVAPADRDIGHAFWADPLVAGLPPRLRRRRSQPAHVLGNRSKIVCRSGHSANPSAAAAAGFGARLISQSTAIIPAILIAMETGHDKPALWAMIDCQIIALNPDTARPQDQHAVNRRPRIKSPGAGSWTVAAAADCATMLPRHRPSPRRRSRKQ